MNLRMRVILSVVLTAALCAAAVPLLAQEGGGGEALYNKYCSQCHGTDGAGLGIAAKFLKPAPRDFTKGKFKVRRTPTGSLPLDEDLMRVVEVGLPYTSMPGFSELLSDSEIKSIVEHVKGFSADFVDPELKPETIEIPSAPPYTEESVARGAEIYVQTGCGACHGEIGYGDGSSAPSLKDDWGVHIRAADLSQPWTFRGGGTREDIFRTMSAGFNGTPMPGFHGALSAEDIWGIVDYMISLSGGPSSSGTTEAPYDTAVQSVGTGDDLDLGLGGELFANAPIALFPIVGQIIEPGRNFYPSAVSVSVQAVHNEKEIAFRVSWHDMRAETVGTNGPDVLVPRWEEQLEETDWSTVPGGRPSVDGDSAGGAGDEESLWGDAEEEDEGDFWGEEEEEEDIWGDSEVSEDDEGDFWGEEEDDGGSGLGVAGSGLPAGPQTEFNDAVALQFPLAAPTGVRRPYFIFGDTQNPVDLWFRDLGATKAENWTGRGSVAITPAEGSDPLESVASYEKGEWSVIFKRKRKSTSSISFGEGTFVPFALSVWDGFNRERGNKRGLSGWKNVYISPLEKPDPLGPMLRAGFGVLGLELLVIALIRRKYRNSNTNKNEEQQAS